MAKAAFDGFLELVANQKHMSTVAAGETLDAKKSRGEGGTPAIEINSFTFGPKDALAAAAKQREEMRKQEDQGEEIEPTGGSPTGKQADDYRFQITKEVEKSSPYLMRAYFSNSFREKRREFNDYSEAKITLRKAGAKMEEPYTYLTIRFLGVHVTGYKLETQGRQPPKETIEFCFQACEMKYRPQSARGESETAIIEGWNFRDKRFMTISNPNEED